MSMEPLQILFFLAVFCAPAAAVGCGLLAWALWRARCEAARSLAAASAMGRRLAVAEKKVEAVARLASDQARRVASLESRLPRKRLGALPESADKPKSPAEASITERRHRVLALSRRGMSAELIAQTLGVPHGEVELIISLNLLS
ncbi:MAG: hypothetical protein SF339_05535 [Blastocatellia bacterium]|nr:hypothetical protein [Blastocatellia bacterium]